MAVTISHWRAPPTKWRRAGCLAAYASGLIAATTMLSRPLEPALSMYLGGALESRVPAVVLSPASDVQGIIVLGGAVTRVEAALSLARRYSRATVILSGPGASEIQLAEAQLGGSGRLKIDRRANDTFENAVYSNDLLAPGDDENWLLVTSAVHMPRAIGAFQAMGFPVLPWPVYDTPSAAKARSAWVWHEVFGLVGYWLLGRTQTPYPRSSGNVKQQVG